MQPVCDETSLEFLDILEKNGFLSQINSFSSNRDFLSTELIESVRRRQGVSLPYNPLVLANYLGLNYFYFPSERPEQLLGGLELISESLVDVEGVLKELSDLVQNKPFVGYRHSDYMGQILFYENGKRVERCSGSNFDYSLPDDRVISSTGKCIVPRRSGQLL